MNFHFSVSHLVFIILLLSLTVRVTVADDEKDKEECTQELVGMATCLPYVGGDAKAPTPDCCSGLKQVLKNNKKCLCVIIKDRDDPDLGLQINVTLALTLPQTCHAPANVSQCPALLKLDPNSPEAQVFYQLGNNSSSHDAAAPTSPASSNSSTDMGENDHSRGVLSKNYVWCKEQDEVLIQSLLELATNGTWRCDNGTFKPGYLLQLEKLMRTKIPGCLVKAKHIDSRIRLLKKQYNAISEMLGPNCSGFGWNDSEKCIDCPKDVFDEWVKSHPTAKGLRNKSFPYLDELTIIFGKDRATGLGAQSPEDMAKDVEFEREHVWEDFQDCYIPEPLEEVNLSYMRTNVDMDGFNTTKHTQNETLTPDESSSRRGKKRMRNKEDTVDVVTTTMDKLGTMYEKTTENISEIAAYFKQEALEVERRTLIFNELLMVEELTNVEQVRAARILVKDHDQTHLFFSLPNGSYKTEFVRQMLSEHFGS